MSERNDPVVLCDDAVLDGGLLEVRSGEVLVLDGTGFAPVGMHGGHWSLTEELTFDVFVATLYAMPKGKAVGMSGFSVELLTIYEKGGAEQREFFDAIMSDLRQGMIPASWKVVVYALLVKPPPNNPAVVAERREIAIMDQLMKTVEKAVQRRASAGQ